MDFWSIVAGAVIGIVIMFIVGIFLINKVLESMGFTKNLWGGR